MGMRDEIEARLAAATPGPWTTTKPGKTEDGWQHGVAIAATYGRQMIYATPSGGQFPAADQTLIANAPTDIRWLLDEVERLRAALETSTVRPLKENDHG